MKQIFLKLILPVLAFCTVSCGDNHEDDTAPQDNSQIVNVYSHRSYDVDKLLYEQFESETGIKVNVISDDADKLIAKLQMSSSGSDADLLITVDAARLWRAEEAGLFDTLADDELNTKISTGMISGSNTWIALTKRARVIAYDPNKVSAEELQSWEDLTKPRFKGEIAVRSSNNVYNQSLLAAMIASNGEEEALKWAEGIVSNMAGDPKGNDRDQIRKVAAGEASVAIVNTYYYGMMSNSEDQADKEVAEKTKLAFPIIPGGGTHINVSGIGLLKSAPNRENAISLIAFLTSEKAQNIYGEMNYEYPTNPDAMIETTVASWGNFEADDTPLDSLGAYNAAAVKVFDKAGWK